MSQSIVAIRQYPVKCMAGEDLPRHWLKPFAAAREMRVGVYTDVVEMGGVSIGDVVAAVRSTDALETSDTIA